MGPLSSEDSDAAWQLGRFAFGGPAQRPADRPGPPVAGVHTLGAFDGGRLVGKAVDLEHAYVYGGRAVPGVGVAGVAMAPEHRGGGVLRALLGPLMDQARERGAIISALYPTASVPYRQLAGNSPASCAGRPSRPPPSPANGARTTSASAPRRPATSRRSARFTQRQRPTAPGC